MEPVAVGGDQKKTELRRGGVVVYDQHGIIPLPGDPRRGDLSPDGVDSADGLVRIGDFHGYLDGAARSDGDLPVAADNFQFGVHRHGSHFGGLLQVDASNGAWRVELDRAGHVVAGHGMHPHVLTVHSSANPTAVHGAGDAVVTRRRRGNRFERGGEAIQPSRYVEGTDVGGRAVEGRVCDEYGQEDCHRGRGHAQQSIAARPRHSRPRHLRPRQIDEGPARNGHHEPGQSQEADDAQEHSARNEPHRQGEFRFGNFTGQEHGSGGGWQAGQRQVGEV